MNIRVFRILSLLLLIRIIFTYQFILILYWVVLVASVEILNRRREYKYRSKSFTLLFFIYLLFITIVRTSGYKLNTAIVYVINVFEHLLFALVISFMISLYLSLLSSFKSDNDVKRYWLSAMIFNIIGLINELYQNIARHKPPFIFSFGAKVDLLVNVTGSLLFVLLALTYTKRTKTRAMEG
jgi:hypothetical protein